jgi:hypothetical protein
LLKSGTCFGGHWDCPILCVCIPAVFINNWSYHLIPWLDTTSRPTMLQSPLVVIIPLDHPASLLCFYLQAD